MRELGTGKSRLETAKSHGINFRIVRDIGVADGIDAARLILPRCWFDETKCRAGLEALERADGNLGAIGQLAEAALQPELQDLYHGLLASEARHHGVYLKLAEQLAPPHAVQARLSELAEHEARVLAGVPPLPRMHA